MYSEYKLNKQYDNIQPWRNPFPIWNQSIVPCPVLPVGSWPATEPATEEAEANIETEETAEEEDQEESIEAFLPQGYENVANVFEAKCVFKPYYEGYQQDDIIAIPMTKDEFYNLKEKKQIKIFKRAEKKHSKK